MRYTVLYLTFGFLSVKNSVTDTEKTCFDSNNFQKFQVYNVKCALVLSSGKQKAIASICLEHFRKAEQNTVYKLTPCPN